jgi:hypothetical protein
MIHVLRRPFPPLADKPQRLQSAFLIALFVFGFLYVFQPFGLSRVGVRLLPVAALYGLITLSLLLVTQLVFPILFRPFYSDNKWTVGREIAQSMGHVLLISVGNFLLSCYLGFFPWSFDIFFLFVGFTFAIGIIPVVVQALIRQYIYHLRNAKAVNVIIAMRLRQITFPLEKECGSGNIPREMHRLTYSIQLYFKRIKHNWLNTLLDYLVYLVALHNV